MLKDLKDLNHLNHLKKTGSTILAEVMALSGILDEMEPDHSDHCSIL